MLQQLLLVGVSESFCTAAPLDPELWALQWRGEHEFAHWYVPVLSGEVASLLRVGRFLVHARRWVGAMPDEHEESIRRRLECLEWHEEHGRVG